jgi:predicted CoA-binding protein
MTTRKQIDQFLASGPIAMAGVSRNPKKFGRMAFDDLSRKGLKIIPINPNIENIDGVTCYPDVNHLPKGVQSIIIITPKNQTLQVVQDAVALGIRNIWIQQSSDTPETLAFLKGKEVNLITKQCILMHHEPDGFHKFHRNLKRLFGAMPR